ncbi:MAG: copper chaperone PCu(A)C [Nocardioides sp.]
MAMVDGATSMQAVDGGIVLEAGRGKVLEPGGFHVMLMGLRDTLAPGEEVDLSLVLSDGSTREALGRLMRLWTGDVEALAAGRHRATRRRGSRCRAPT